MPSNEMIVSLDDINMPFSLEAEQAVLGCILSEPECISQVIILLKPDYFYLPQHRAIFTIMQEIDSVGGKIDPLIVLERLKNDNIYDDASGKNYLYQLAQSVPSTENVESYCKIIREKFYIRTLITVSKDTIEDSVSGDMSADMLLDRAEQKIYDIRQGRVSKGPTKIGDIIVNEVYDKLQKLSSADKDQYKGVSTGFVDLDKATTGLNKSDLVIVGARPAMGKTSFALNLARNVAMKGKKVLFFSLEMTKEQLAERVLSTEARVLSTKMRTGEISDEEWPRLATATALLSKCELYFDDSSNMTVPEMKSRIRRLKGVDAVFVDYLQLMKSGGRVESRTQEVTEITRNLKLMAKDLNIPVVVLAQLSRATEARGKSHKPQLADLRESGSIEQDADIVIMLYRDEYYDSEKEDGDEPQEEKPAVNKVEFIIAKNRHGPTTTVEAMWNGDYTLFSDMEKIHNDM
ncbi:MAG: replicative DNA helicase [Acutalibacteraceae bacterium]